VLGRGRLPSSVRYEFLIQARSGPYDAAALEALLDARGAKVQGDGTRVWRLPSGEVECRRWVEAGAVVASELKVPLSDRLELIREVVQEASALAKQLDARLVDPQLSRDVGLADEGAIVDQFLRTAQFAGRYQGVSEAVGASFAADDDGGIVRPQTKVLLGLIAACVVLYLLADLVLGAAPPPKVPRVGPPPGLEAKVDAGSLGPLKVYEGAQDPPAPP